MWHDTNYAAQMKEADKAGLNPGLLYGGGGGGGTTAGSQAGNVSGGQAQQNPGEVQKGMGIGLETMQLSLLNAQKELLESQKKKIDSEVPVNEASVPKINSETNANEMANKWEAWKQSHNEEGYRVDQGVAYNKDGTIAEGQNTKTWKESEGKMQYDKIFQEINGIMKENAIKDEQVSQVIAATAEIGQKIDLMKKQGVNIDQITSNLIKDGTIKQFEIDMNKIGLIHSSISDIIKLLIHKL